MKQPLERLKTVVKVGVERDKFGDSTGMIAEVWSPPGSGLREFPIIQFRTVTGAPAESADGSCAHSETHAIL